MEYKFNGTLLHVVSDFCKEYLLDLATLYNEKMKNYTFVFKYESNLDFAKKHLCSMLETLDDSVRTDSQEFKLIIMNGLQCGNNIAFAAEASFIKKDDIMRIRDSKLTIVANEDILTLECMGNLYRFDEWLNNDVAARLRHEFGHLLGYIEDDGNTFDEWFAKNREHNDALKEYESWRIDAEENGTFNMEEGCERYYALPYEARANAFGGVGVDELIKVHTYKDASDDYTIEIKSYETKKDK